MTGSQCPQCGRVGMHARDCAQASGEQYRAAPSSRYADLLGLVEQWRAEETYHRLRAQPLESTPARYAEHMGMCRMAKRHADELAGLLREMKTMPIFDTTVCLSTGTQLRRIAWDRWTCRCDNCTEYRALRLREIGREQEHEKDHARTGEAEIGERSSLRRDGRESHS